MLTGYKSAAKASVKASQTLPAEKDLKSSNTNANRNNGLTLLKEAIQNILEENSHRVYIQDDPYLVDFKFPGAGFAVEDLKQALEKNQLQFVESKVVGGEILTFTYRLLLQLSPENQKADQLIEVWYKPLPRMRM